MNEVTMSLVVAPTTRSIVWAFVFVVVLPVLTTWVAVFVANRALTVTVTGAVTALSVILFAALAWFLSRNEIMLDGQALTVRAAFYERSVNRADIDWNESHFIDAARDSGLAPRVRVNGIGLPGYRAGWFRLANGARAFVLQTQGPLAYLPVTGGEAFLLTVTRSSPLFEKIGTAGPEA